MRRLGPKRRLDDRDDDPLSGVANFFDLGIVFSLGFMLTLATLAGARAKGQRQDDGRGPDVTDRAVKRARLRASKETLRGAGERLGTAYRLTTGEIVYVPDGTPGEVRGPEDEERRGGGNQ